MPIAWDELDAGDGLKLRHFTLADGATLSRSIEANRPHLRRYLPWVDRSTGMESVYAFLLEAGRAKAESRWLAYGMWQDGEFCGSIGTHDIDWLNQNLSLGYWISRTHEGRGIVTRACRRMLVLAFDELGMQRVEIRVAQGNERSAAIPERLGFRLEGVLRHAQILTEGPADLRVYGLLREERR